MYQKLYIDKNLEVQITDELKQVFFDYSMPFEYIKDSNILESNALFLTDNKNNLSDTLINVFLLKEDYDFLDVKNAIFIKNIEDIVRVFKDDVWKKWAQELQFLSQCSLAYSKDKFDRERSERIRAAVIKDNKILLVKEQFDGKWALPGGYQDVNKSIRENVIKEASEEAGAVVNPLKVVAVLDYNRHHHVNFPFGMVKIFVLCEYVSHSFAENTETLGAEFYSLDELPDLSITRTTKKQLEMCFDCYNNVDNWNTIFD